jgi:hypothetical protein
MFLFIRSECFMPTTSSNVEHLCPHHASALPDRFKLGGPWSGLATEAKIVIAAAVLNYGGHMSLSRTVLSVASIFLGLSAAAAQQPTTAAQQPLFQGIVVDAKGKTVGRLLDRGSVVRTVSGFWVALDVLPSGFYISNGQPPYYFQSADCTGPQYMDAGSLPPYGAVISIPFFSQPTLIFPGTSVTLSIASTSGGGSAPGCSPVNPPQSLRVGAVQSFEVNSWGFVPPFSAR